MCHSSSVSSDAERPITTLRCVKFFRLQSTALRKDADRADDFGTIYEENFHLLVGTAVDRFRISHTDAEGLAHEVFLSYFLKANEIIDSRAWLVSAICNASKHYLRSRARLVSTDALEQAVDPRSIAENLQDQLVAREAFACTSAKCQVALHLRYIEGYSIPEVAQELSTTARYAAKLVSRCLKQAQDRYRKKGGPDERA